MLSGGSKIQQRTWRVIRWQTGDEGKEPTCSSSRRGAWSTRSTLATGLTLLAASGTAFGQLSPADIRALQEQGKAEGWTFTVGENSATSYSLEELCGLVMPEDWRVDARFDPCTPTRALPEYFNWCDQGGCTPVKHQGGCGSCWAFGTVGPLECNILIKDGVTVNLSEQWLVSCNSDGYSCGGGWWAHDYHQWKTDPCGGTGAVLEEHFPYVAYDAACNCPYPHEYLIDNWSYIGTPWTVPPVDSIKQAIMDYGPVSAAVHANSAMQAYTGGIFNGCATGTINHAVVLVGWDDNQGTNGIWFMRNSWGAGWGEGGYMRMPYGCSDIGYNACYVDYPGAAPLSMNLSGGTPDLIAPGDSPIIKVEIIEISDTYVPGSGTLYYRYDGGTWLTDPLVPVGGGLHQATLPQVSCGDSPEFYFSIEGETSGSIYEPPDAPATRYVAEVGEYITVFSDDFESHQGWTVENSPGLVDGAWNRGVPVGGGDRGDPPSDFDGSGACYLTDNVDGNSDVDDGTTTLVSPMIDVSGMMNPQVRYARWYSNVAGDSPQADTFVVRVSDNDGASWVELETVGPAGQEVFGSWYVKTFSINDFVSPTDEVKFRFEASDLGNGSVVE